jgi:hypothetical protein
MEMSVRNQEKTEEKTLGARATMPQVHGSAE